MINTRICIRIAAALAAASLFAPAAALADSYYAQAWARVDVDGSLLAGQNVVSSEMISTGTYCVRFTPEIDPATSAIVATLRHDDRTISAHGPGDACGDDPSGVTVRIYQQERPAIGSFDLAIL
ncbi:MULTISPECIES: hypothetical protein [unclassified Nonomuraea]|uniref:hypothetical protein n=1 Tax=unclassified Nonomuraea TaxID=2593643 RepID=UPI0035BEEE5B